MARYLLLVLLMFAAVFSSGCDDKTGILEDPAGPASYVTPTISNLQVQTTSISRRTGGILQISCEWVSPAIVSTATAYLGFVKTIQDYVHEPVGVIGSGTASAPRRLSFNIQGATTTDVASFYERFRLPIAIPTKVGTNRPGGLWSAQIPLPHEDIFNAPDGVHQMVFYMSINGLKTNTLSFEMTFVP